VLPEWRDAPIVPVTVDLNEVTSLEQLNDLLEKAGMKGLWEEWEWLELKEKNHRARPCEPGA
jgi:hypothetical protein